MCKSAANVGGWTSNFLVPPRTVGVIASPVGVRLLHFTRHVRLLVCEFECDHHDVCKLCLSTIKEGIDTKPPLQVASGKAHNHNGGPRSRSRLKRWSPHQFKVNVAPVDIHAVEFDPDLLANFDRA